MLLKNALWAFIFSLLLVTGRSEAQNFENAGEYMGFISKANEELTATYLSYLSAVAHNRAKKVEKRRMDVLTAISETRYKIQGMPPWKGDRSYRDSTVSYMKLLNHIFNDDYAKIVNMEEIAEQSYDLMEAYMMAQQKVSEKLEQASSRQQEMQKQFAAKYNITLVNSEDDLERKNKVASALMKHHDDIYLVFFKPFKQEVYLTEAVNKKNVIAIEENRNAMKKYAEEGLTKLKDLRGYNNDPSLILACRKTLDFYKKEADQTQTITDFFLTEENFTKIKKAFDTKPAAKRTQADIDAFNKAVGDINKAVDDYNKVNKQMNRDRENLMNEWNKAVKRYLDVYMPVQRKVS